MNRIAMPVPASSRGCRSRRARVDWRAGRRTQSMTETFSMTTSVAGTSRGNGPFGPVGAALMRAALGAAAKMQAVARGKARGQHACQSPDIGARLRAARRAGAGMDAQQRIFGIKDRVRHWRRRRRPLDQQRAPRGQAQRPGIGAGRQLLGRDLAKGKAQHPAIWRRAGAGLRPEPSGTPFRFRGIWAIVPATCWGIR